MQQSHGKNWERIGIARILKHVLTLCSLQLSYLSQVANCLITSKSMLVNRHDVQHEQYDQACSRSGLNST